MTVYERVKGRPILLEGREDALSYMLDVLNLQPIGKLSEVDDWVRNEVVDAYFSDDQWSVHHDVDPATRSEIERRVYYGAEASA